MTHTFKVDLASIYGIEEAIVIDKLVGWIDHNEANNQNFHDGRFWTYNSCKGLIKQFPYMKEGKIKRILTGLVEAGLLMKGNYNENQYDRTCWYAFTDEGHALVKKYYIHCPKMTNGKVRNGRPIPNNQPNNQPYTFTPSDEGSDGCLFDDADTSTLTMLSSEEKLPYAERPATPTAGEFEDLWLAYERKGSKAKAKKEFDKLTAEEIATMRCHIPAYLQSRPEKQYRQDFERYIKHKTFNSVVYSKQNEILYDPDAHEVSVTMESVPEHTAEDSTFTINGVTYR